MQASYFNMNMCGGGTVSERHIQTSAAHATQNQPDP